ncbi:AAA family ATPase, partial [Oharaeibacter diazotrophicus]
MRLLAVRGRNIASLAEPFELDLSAEPLASAGLFAIVGRTGAGKSSILDALCIALYGACPRNEVGDGGEEVPDGPGRTLKAGDPRTCVSRGAAEAFAEADFVGVDGVTYRARWAVRRARNRVDGTLQKVERSVTDLDRGVVVANQVTEAGAVVVDRTRLTFAEFCRTVLLPQGQFDALLAANAKDRAALLEKITGTGHYRDISIAAHRHAADAAARVHDHETRRAATGVLADDDRAALDAERGALDAAETADADRRTAVDEALR